MKPPKPESLAAAELGARTCTRCGVRKAPAGFRERCTVCRSCIDLDAEESSVMYHRLPLWVIEQRSKGVDHGGI